MPILKRNQIDARYKDMLPISPLSDIGDKIRDKVNANTVTRFYFRLMKHRGHELDIPFETAVGITNNLINKYGKNNVKFAFEHAAEYGGANDEEKFGYFGLNYVKTILENLDNPEFLFDEDDDEEDWD